MPVYKNCIPLEFSEQPGPEVLGACLDIVVDKDACNAPSSAERRSLRLSFLSLLLAVDPSPLSLPSVEYSRAKFPLRKVTSLHH
jgi:hypothetical protein